MGCLAAVGVRNQAVGLKENSIMNFVQNRARRLADVNSERAVRALDSMRASNKMSGPFEEEDVLL